VEKAEGQLLDLIKMCKSEGWEMLADDARIDLATCQRHAQRTVKSVIFYLLYVVQYYFFSASTLLVWYVEWHPYCKKISNQQSSKTYVKPGLTWSDLQKNRRVKEKPNAAAAACAI